MKALRSPYLRIVISLVQFYLGLQFLGVLPGLTGTGTTMSNAIGGFLLFGGFWGVVQAVQKRNFVEEIVLDELDLEEVKELISEGKEIKAITHIRKKTGASLAEAKSVVDSIKTSSN